jgi:flagellar motor switch protein FliG
MIYKKTDRIQQVAELLNAVGRDAETKILSTLEEANPNLTRKIRDRMFTFDDLTQIGSRQMKLVLKELDPEDLVLALKTANEAVKELIFSSMSSNAADTLREDLENLGLKKRGDVETAQLKIVQLARKLAEEGKIVLMDSVIV